METALGSVAGTVARIHYANWDSAHIAHIRTALGSVTGTVARKRCTHRDSARICGMHKRAAGSARR
eukprot:1160300-Pelagomonas_calceolata.AAC.17